MDNREDPTPIESNPSSSKPNSFPIPIPVSVATSSTNSNTENMVTIKVVGYSYEECRKAL